LPGYEVDIVTHRIGGSDFRIRALHNRQQYADPDGAAERAGVSPASWPLFGVVWPAGLALAEEMSRFPVTGKHILELGCGLGLASLVLARRGADITACDHHPLAGEWKDFRDCHVRPDLVLIYRKPDNATLDLVRLGSHSELGL